jgi:UDP-N-acetylglucosamine acyltransferase
MSARIHPSAIIDPKAQLHESVEVGPGCVVSAGARLGEGVRLIGNVYLEGTVEIGAGTIVYPFACLGFPPQDVKFKPGMASPGVKVGRNCIIREHVTLHAASKMEHPTIAGDNCFIMVGSHLGHDTVIGSNVTMVNATLLAGHVTVGDNVTMGGGVAVHQFCRIGRLAFLSGGVPMSMEVPPFCLAGTRNTLHGLNIVGLRRSGMARDQITLLRKAFRAAFGTRLPREEMLGVLQPFAAQSDAVREMREFIATAKRAVAPARLAMDGSDDDADE